MMMLAMRPAAIVKIPRPRAKMTRGRLPLQIAQRMKLGCDCLRREYSTVAMIEWKADGWVVFWRAWRRACFSREERLSSRGELSAM